MNLFVQNSGKFYNRTGDLLGIGYAGGDKGNALDGVNNPTLEDIPDVGPLPCGFYTVGRPYNHPKCGEYFLPLSPSAANNMFGRGGFGIHGDLVSAPGQHKASDGCIIMSKDVRRAVWESGDHDLQVVSGLIAPDLDGEISGAGG